MTPEIKATMNTKPKEHNPDNLTPEQYGAPEWRLLNRGDRVSTTWADEVWLRGTWDKSQWTGHLVGSDGSTYRRRVTPPADTEDDDFPDIRRPGEVKREAAVADLAAENAALKVDREMRKVAEDELAAISQLFPINEESGVLESVQNAVAWQPIATAPKDGTRIFTTDGKKVGVSRWVYQYQSGFIVDRFISDMLNGEPHTPTHWLPLPPAPTAARAQEETK